MHVDLSADGMSDWPPPMPLVEVYWVDSTGHDGWRDVASRRRVLQDDGLAGCYCRTAGYLVEDVPGWVAVTLGQSASGCLDSMIQIPRQAIVQVRMVQRAREVERHARQAWASLHHQNGASA